MRTHERPDHPQSKTSWVFPSALLWGPHPKSGLGNVLGLASPSLFIPAGCARGRQGAPLGFSLQKVLSAQELPSTQVTLSGSSGSNTWHPGTARALCLRTRHKYSDSLERLQIWGTGGHRPGGLGTWQVDLQVTLRTEQTGFSLKGHCSKVLSRRNCPPRPWQDPVEPRGRKAQLHSVWATLELELELTPRALGPHLAETYS